VHWFRRIHHFCWLIKVRYPVDALFARELVFAEFMVIGGPAVALSRVKSGVKDPFEERLRLVVLMIEVKLLGRLATRWKLRVIVSSLPFGSEPGDTS
jgi:hypothetical protein